MNYIYCFTNLINGKKYIGSTIKTPKERFNQHMYHVHNQTEKSNYPLYAAIRKYGIKNFSYDILYQGECSEEEIRKIEHDFIVFYNTVSPNGYNATDNTQHPLTEPKNYEKMKNTKRENAKQVAMIDKESGKLIQTFRSIVDCEEATSLPAKQIAACCRGEQRSAHNYIFYWIDDNGDYIIPQYHGFQYKGKQGTTQVQSTSKKVAKMTMDGEILAIYDTIALAARENDCDSSGISKVCRGVRNSAKGFKWKYVE